MMYSSRFPPIRNPGLTALLLVLATVAQVSFAEAPLPDAIRAAGILPGWRSESGTQMTAFTLTLASGWKTYWRAPGDSGIPPHFDWSGSRNVASVKIHWPRPEVFSVNGLQQIGYHDQLVLPIEITPRDPALPVHLAAQVALGVCKDICVPASLSLSAELEGAGAPNKVIRAALNDRPESAAEAGLVSITCDVAPIADGLALNARIRLPDQGGPEVVVFETADATVWVAPSTTSRDGPLLIARSELVATTGAPFALDRSAVIVTVLGQSGAVEIRGCPAPD